MKLKFNFFLFFSETDYNPQNTVIYEIHIVLYASVLSNVL